MTGKWRETIYGRIAVDFSMTTLRDLCDTEAGIQTGPFGSQLHQKDYVRIGTPIITVEHIGENHLIHDELPYVSNRDLDRLSRYKLQFGDIVFSRVGSVDRRALVRSSENGWLFSGRCLRIRPSPERIDSSYLSYFFGFPTFKEYIRMIAVGATMPSLNTSLLSDILVPHPRDICEQRAIAHILRTLDDKIELNRKMNATLEEMARAIFKSWFVDFEPVRAKMDGRWQRGQSFPGLPAHLFDLFPDKLVDSELGEIPEGWEVKPIGELAEVVGGSTPNTKRIGYWDSGTHHWVTPKDLSGLPMPVLLDTERKITDAGLAQISSGLLPKGTVLLSSRAPIGYIAISEVPVAINQGFIAMKPRHGISNLFLMRWASAAHDEIVSRANGSTFLEISKTNFRPIPTVAPSSLIMDAFEQISRPLYKKLVENEHESRTLASLRDTLLPKLISGQIRVKDAERFLKERGL